ncbi:MAG: hypothetical protein K2K53_13440, partial [Oscillospiraceae bacterium]|nr:hypothetical protein [Oscillospiraceae bacterium]
TYVSQYGSPSALHETNVDVLAYAVAMSLRKDISGTAGFLDFSGKEQNSYTIMADILKAMNPGGAVQGAGTNARSGQDPENLDFESGEFDVQGVIGSAVDSLLAAVDKSVERAHAEVERTVQDDWKKRIGYIQFEDRMVPINIM